MVRISGFGFRISTIGVLLTLIVIGWGVASYKLSLVREIRHVGHADEAAYAEMGRALAAGRWFNVRHVSVFFIPYDRGIERREDHWPPFMGMAIAPCLWLIGVEAWAAKLPAIFFGSIGLPLATAALGMAVSRRAYVGLLAGLCMLADVTLFTESLKTLSDIALATLVTAWLAAIIGARHHPRLHLLACVFASAAFYAKGSHLILIALWPVASLLVEGWRVFTRRWIYIGIATTALLLSPWLIANCIDYGRPLHSTQNYAAGYIGLDDWETRFYRPHWGRDLPGVSDRWTQYGDAYADEVAKNREAFTRYALLGPRASSEQWYDLGTIGATIHTWLAPDPTPITRLRQHLAPPTTPAWRPASWRDPVTTWCTILATLTLTVTTIAFPLRQLPRLRFSAPPQSTPTPPPHPSLPGPFAAILLTALAQWLFVVYLWDAMPRLAFVFLPSVAVIAATGVSRVIELPFCFRGRGFIDRWHWVAAPPLCIAALLLTWAYSPQLKAYHIDQANTRVYPYADEPMYPLLGDWFAAHAPDAVVMARRPWQLRFSCPDTLKAVGMPYAAPPVILWIAKYYHVTHYLDDMHRPGMHRYLHGRHPAFIRVTDAPGSAPGSAPGQLYRIDWAKLNNNDLQPPHDGAALQ